MSTKGATRDDSVRWWVSTDVSTGTDMYHDVHEVWEVMTETAAKSLRFTGACLLQTLKSTSGLKHWTGTR